MRIRTIKPEFWTSPDVAALDRDERLVYIGLWSYSDDAGRGLADARLLAAALFPFEAGDPSTVELIKTTLRKLETGGQVTCYEVRGRQYYEIASWAEHQRINRPSKSTIPASDERTDAGSPANDDSARAHEALTEPSVSPPTLVTHASPPEREGKGARDQGEGGAQRAPRGATALPDDFALSDNTRTWAATECPDIDVDRATAKFTHHARSNAWKRTDWDAALRKWLLAERPAERTTPHRRDAAANAAALAGFAAKHMGAPPAPAEVAATPEGQVVAGDWWQTPESA